MEDNVKYVIIVGDGMADYPLDSLGGKTPLMVARTPVMDWMVKHGEVGLVKTVPDGFNPGSEIANLSILGYDPHLCYTGRGPLEAASLGVRLQPDDIAFRCNLVTLKDKDDQILMDDFAAGHISDEEAKHLILDLDREFGTEEIRFYPGVSYRHVMVWNEGAKKHLSLDEIELTPPHDIIGKGIGPFLPGAGNPVQSEGSQEDGAVRILDLMNRSQPYLKDHPINLSRVSRGQRPGNSIWLWGQGRSPQMVSLKKRFGIDGFVISAVHLLKGMGVCAGLEVVEVPGATGYFDTNYEGKVRYTLAGLSRKNFGYVHVEAPDEAGHMGDPGLKIEAIEVFDEKIVGAILKGMNAFPRYKILVLPDHATPLSIRTHAPDPVPYLIYSNEKKSRDNSVETFDEVSASRSGLFVERGYQLIERFLKLPER
ncbi:MAG TPA: cofactor-independent phosphoglycerate mutase [Thermodesulfobacteriota bacterium]|nr:cofactor-independent phosphoglycerate mutase [Thermodesulfobacteriota bacterium]